MKAGKGEVRAIEQKQKKRGVEKVEMPRVDFDLEVIGEIKERKKKVGKS